VYDEKAFSLLHDVTLNI